MLEPGFPVYCFSFRVVTPLFMGGAEPNAAAELRLAAIKGLLRDWYRVLVGPASACRDEPRLAGGAAAGAGQSPYLLAVTPPLTGDEPWEPPHAGRDDISGLRYLGYSLNLGANRRKAIPAGRAFELEAVFPRGARTTQRRQLLACAWLLAHLGGMGTRSRRGFGSVALESWAPAADPDLARLPLLATAADPAAAAAALVEARSVLRRWFPEADAPLPVSADRLGYRLAGARILVVPTPAGTAWRCPLDALDHLGAAMQRFRRRAALDGFSTSALLAAHEHLPFAPRRTSFGLPLSYRTRERVHTFAPFLPRIEDARRRPGRDYARFPSPLLLHVQAIQDGYLPIVTLLGGARPGRDVPVREQRGRGFLAPDPGNDLLEGFLAHLAADGAREVSP